MFAGYPEQQNFWPEMTELKVEALSSNVAVDVIR